MVRLKQKQSTWSESAARDEVRFQDGGYPRAERCAGMYKAMTVRSNPRLRTVNSVLRTYITVLHVLHQQKDVMFSSVASKAHGVRSASEVPATPGTPGSMAGSEVGSQVHSNLHFCHCRDCC
jgi:hypothetical protein